MKRTFLIFGLCLVFFGCGDDRLNENKNIENNSNKIKLDGGYFVKNDKIFYKRGWLGNVLEVKDGDVKTFKVVYKDSYRNSYAKDKNNVYYYNEVIKGADPETFELLEVNGVDYIAKDKNRIFLLDEGGYYPDEELDVDKFRSIGYEYFTDDKNIWVVSMTSDGDFLNMIGEDEKWEVDLKTFEVIGNGYAKDKFRVFRSASSLINSDPDTFELLKPPYAKDKNNCYKYWKIVNMSECEKLKTTIHNENKLDPLCNIQEPPEDRCEGQYYGAVFNKKTNKCEYDVWGCDDPPFKSVDECKNVCEKQL